MSKREYSSFDNKIESKEFKFISADSIKKTNLDSTSYQSALFEDIPLPRNSEVEFKNFVKNLSPHLERELPLKLKDVKGIKSVKSVKSVKDVKKIKPTPSDSPINVLTNLQSLFTSSIPKLPEISTIPSLIPRIVSTNSPPVKEKYSNIENPYETKFEYFGNNELFGNIDRKDDRNNCDQVFCSIDKDDVSYSPSSGSTYGAKDTTPKSVQRESGSDKYTVSKKPNHAESFSNIDNTVINSCDKNFCSIDNTIQYEVNAEYKSNSEFHAPSFVQKRSAEFEYNVGKKPIHYEMRKNFRSVEKVQVVEPKYGSFAPFDGINDTYGNNKQDTKSYKEKFSPLNPMEIKESCENNFCMLPKVNGQFEDLSKYDSKYGFSAPSFKAGRSKNFKPLTPTSNKPLYKKDHRAIDEPLIFGPKFGTFAPFKKITPKKITGVKSIVSSPKSTPKLSPKSTPKLKVSKASPKAANKKPSPKPVSQKLSKPSPKPVPTPREKAIKKQDALPIVKLNQK